MKQARTPQPTDYRAIVLALVVAVLLGFEGAFSLWLPAFVVLAAGLLFYSVRSAFVTPLGLLTVAVTWLIAVPLVVFLAFDTGHLTHYGLAILALYLSGSFARKAVQSWRK